MELLVGALIVLGFLAVAARFVVRDPSGGIVLPRIVDDSIGMWMLRRLTGRPLGERGEEDEPAPASPFDPNASKPTRTALGATAAASARPSAISLAITATPVADLRRRQQRRLPPPREPRALRWLPLSVIAAIVIAVVVAVMALDGFSLGSPLGEVLGATGRPGGSELVVGPPSHDPSLAPSSPLPSQDVTLVPTSSPDPTATARPVSTSRPTARPTSTPAPTASPSPPTATPNPTPKPTPSPTSPPQPPVALVVCTPPALVTTTCDGSGSARAVTYRFDFGDGTIQEGTESSRPHTYLLPGDYVVTLTVIDALGRQASDSTTVSIL